MRHFFCQEKKRHINVINVQDVAAHFLTYIVGAYIN